MVRRFVKPLMFVVAVLFVSSTLAFAAAGTVKAIDDKGMATVTVGDKEQKGLECKGAKVGDKVTVTTADGKTTCTVAK